MSDFPAFTPPAHVREVSHEDLALEMRELRRQRAEDYAAIRDVRSTMEANHLAVLHHLGELAKAVGGT